MLPHLVIVLALVVPGQTATKSTARKPNILAPSLPTLTDEEEAKLDKIIDRFIEFDTGKLTGDEGKKAQEDFNNLGPEAIFALVRGLNKAAEIEATCPAVTIGKKILAIIRTTHDRDLLEYLRENLGAGIKQSVHMNVIKDLRSEAAMRKRRAKGAAPWKPEDESAKIVIRPRRPGEVAALKDMSVKELAKAAGAEKGDKLKDVLNEVQTRTGETAYTILAAAAGNDTDSQLRYHAQDLLIRFLGKQPDATIMEKLGAKEPEVRSAAAKVAGEKKLQVGEELVGLLEDKDVEVRIAAREALVRLAGGPDSAPDKDLKEENREQMVKLWRTWWAKKITKVPATP